MKRVGLILANPITNYGAHLQAFATQYAIDQLGVSTVVIDTSKIKDDNYIIDIGFFSYAIKRLVHRFTLKNNNVTYDDAFRENVRLRTIAAANFRARMLHDEVSYKTYKDLIEAASGFNAIIIGSDQMWLPGSSFSPINSLQFVPKGVRRLSYATSLGVSKYPRSCWKSARKMWLNMDAISVREQQGADIIREVCDNTAEVKVVLDPTYLLSKEQWENVMPFMPMTDEKYVFCYFLGNNERGKLCAQRYAREHGVKLVSILSTESYDSIDRSYADQTLEALSPEDFINWLRGAECVFTDSFHGLAFSVINHKQFFVFYRVRKDSKLSRNSRIDNILKLFDCVDRLVTNPDIDWDHYNVTSIDYDQVECIMSKERKASLYYLKNALEVNED